jgi:hypothetical protein
MGGGNDEKPFFCQDLPSSSLKLSARVYSSFSALSKGVVAGMTFSRNDVVIRMRYLFIFFGYNMHALVLNTGSSFRAIHLNELACLDIIFSSLNVNPVYDGFLNLMLAHFHSNV